MEKYLFIGFLIGSFSNLINSLGIIPLKKKWRRECHYNCENCRVWDCDYHSCRWQMKKDIKKTFKKVGIK